ncbi:MAG: PQQ-dependent sugar dehydrogenase [Bacteroidota bacterium]|nr:PQQ-dependent sugar dehydrogenase [Bacteroidota bacterium]
MRISNVNTTFLILFLTITLRAQIHREAWEVLKGNTNSPSKVEFKDSYLKELKLPQGFKVTIYAKGVKGARMIAQSPDNGVVYITSPKQGSVYALYDTDKKGKANKIVTTLKGIKNVHGIAINNKQLYLCAPEKLMVCDIMKDGSVSKPKTLISDLPEGGRHENRTIGFGPDGMLYISVGSSCNACIEKNKEHATILRAAIDGSKRNIFCSGLRNTIGFSWHPITKVMWGMDQGSDWRGNDTPPEELNKLEEGQNYGWPYCYSKSLPDKEMEQPRNSSKEDYCKKTVPSVLDYQAHSSPIAMVFYNSNMFSEEYKGDAFIAFHGSWNRSSPVGYKVVRVRFNKSGTPEKFEDFMSGFLIENGKKQFGRPAGLCVLNDGSLLVSDDNNDMIYRITYSK